MTEQKILAIIPAYNEEATIAGVINNIRFRAPEADILVVNDGSRDNTSEIAHAQGVQVVDLPINLGIGGAMQTGYMYAYRNGYDIAIQVDADGQHDPAFINRLISPLIDDKCDMAIGSRYVKATSYKSSICRRIGMVFFSQLVSTLIGQEVKDTTSGFRAVNSKVIEFFARQYPTDYPEVDVLVRLYRNGFRFCEVPVEMNRRLGGESSITPAHSLYYMIKVSMALIINLVRT